MSSSRVTTSTLLGSSPREMIEVVWLTGIRGASAPVGPLVEKGWTLMMSSGGLVGDCVGVGAAR